MRNKTTKYLILIISIVTISAVGVYKSSNAFKIPGITDIGLKNNEPVEVRYNLSELLAPINKSYEEANDKINSRFPDRKGMIGVVLLKYASGDIMLAEDQEVDKDKTPYSIIGVVAQTLKNDNLQHNNFKPDDFMEIITVDNQENDPLKRTYFFNEKRFDLIYMTKLGIAINQTSERIKAGGIPSIADARDAADAANFTKNLTGLLYEISSGGSALMTQIIKEATAPLLNPDPKAVQ